MKKYLISFCFLLLVYAAWLVQDVIIIIIYFFGGIFAIVLVASFFVSLWFVIEKMLMIRAGRIEQQKQSQVMVIDTSDGTWIRDTGRGNYQALHLQQTVASNKKTLSVVEAEAWQVFNGSKSTTAKPVLSLPETTQPTLLPITERLKSSHQILISGLTGSGKTTLCKHLLTWLVSQGYSIVPCDIHSPGTMLGFDVIGSGRKFQDIFNALDVVTETMNKRYNMSNYGQSDFNPRPIAIFMDELTTLVKEAKKTDYNFSDVLETLLVEGRKVNIKMILSIHSLDVKTLGLTAGIRENNTMVQLLGGEGSPYQCYVVPPLASIRSKKGWVQHSLPGSFAGGLEQPKFVTKLPDVKSIKIKNLHAQGFPPTAIARNIYNVKKASGRQVQAINTVLGIAS